jgi:hypothetical protein
MHCSSYFLRFCNLNNIIWKVQIVKLIIMHTYRWSFLSVRYHKPHARTTSTPTHRQYALCHTQHSTTSYSHTICRQRSDLYCSLSISYLKAVHPVVLWRKYKTNNNNRRTDNLFYNHNKSLHVSTHRCHHQYSSTERIDRIQQCWQKWYLICLLFVSGLIGW